MTKKIEIHKGKFFMLDDLHAAFDLVKNKDNWKLGIGETIPLDKVEIVDAAIIFFAGGEAEFSAPFKTKDGFAVVVTAPGYFNVIGA